MEMRYNLPLDRPLMVRDIELGIRNLSTIFEIAVYIRYLVHTFMLVSGLSVLWYEELFCPSEHSLIADKEQEFGISCSNLSVFV